MTISATSQGLRPGVCTSSNRPANPFDGMMIYETDTDRFAAYDSSAWVYKTGVVSPGLFVVKSETAFSAASTVSATSVFTSSYTNYLLIVNTTASAASPTYNLQLSVGGTAAATNYNIQKFTAASTTLTGSRSTAQTSYNIDGNDNKTTLLIELGSPAVAAVTNIFTRNTLGLTTGLILSLSAGNHNAATSYDGFVITPSSGTLTGTYAVYGYGIA